MKVVVIGPKSPNEKGSNYWTDFYSQTKGKILTIDGVEVLTEHPAVAKSLWGKEVIHTKEFEFLFLTSWVEPVPDFKKGEVRCPLCGWPGWVGFNLIHCSNDSCRNGGSYEDGASP